MTSEYLPRSINTPPGGPDGYTISVKDFGAVGDGVHDDLPNIESAIAAAVNNGGGVVFFPPGTYRCSGQLTVQDGVFLEGSGQSSTVIDFTGATASAFPDNGMIYGGGSLTDEPTIGSNVSAGDVSITLTSTPADLSQDDVLIILNTTDFSFNPQKSDWRAGEMYLIENVSGTTVNLMSPSFDSYSTGANISLWKLSSVTFGVSNMKVVGFSDTSGTVSVIHAVNSRGCVFENLDITGSQRACLEIRRCYQTSIDNIDAFDNGDNVGLNYGIAVVNSQRVTISGCNISVTRHAITHGGAKQDGDVVNRESVVTNCTLSSEESFAFDWHGNCESNTVSNCILQGGSTLGGSLNTIHGNTITTDQNAGIGVTMSGIITMDHMITGNTFIATRDISTTSAGVIQWNRSAPEDITRPGGTMMITENSFAMKDFDGKPVIMITRATTDDINVNFSGNVVKRKLTKPSAGVDGIVFQGDSVSGSAWNKIQIGNNTITGAPLILSECGAQIAWISNNVIQESTANGIQVSGHPSGLAWDNETISVLNNVVSNSDVCGIRIQGTDGTVSTCLVSGNTSVRNNQDNLAGSSSDKSSANIFDFETATFSDNVTGDNQGAPTQAREWAASDIVNLYQYNNTSISSPSLARNFASITNIFGSNQPKMQLTDDTGQILYGNLRSGTGDPNSAIVGSPGDLWLRTDGGAGTTLYVKESGSGTDTGWVGK